MHEPDLLWLRKAATLAVHVPVPQRVYCGSAFAQLWLCAAVWLMLRPLCGGKGHNCNVGRGSHETCGIQPPLSGD